MKKLYKSLIALILILSLLLCIGSVFAIDELNDLPTSEAGDIWQDEIKPLLIVAISSACGSGTGLISLFVILYKTWKANKKQRDEQIAFIQNLATKLGLTKDQIDLVKGNYENLSSKIEDLIKEEIKPYMEETKALRQDIKNLANEYQEFKDYVKETVKQTNISDERIIKILQIAFLNNPELVKNGQATQIKKV